MNSVTIRSSHLLRKNSLRVQSTPGASRCQLLSSSRPSGLPPNHQAKPPTQGQRTNARQSHNTHTLCSQKLFNKEEEEGAGFLLLFTTKPVAGRGGPPSDARLRQFALAYEHASEKEEEWKSSRGFPFQKVLLKTLGGGREKRVRPSVKDRFHEFSGPVAAAGATI